MLLGFPRARDPLGIPEDSDSGLTGICKISTPTLPFFGRDVGVDSLLNMGTLGFFVCKHP